MVLRHATLASNLPSIMETGLDPQRSQGIEAAVWLHTPSYTPWAVLHTQKRHKVLFEGVVVLEVDVPRGWLRRARTGLWKCNRMIHSHRIRVIATGDEVAASPLEGR